MNKLPENNSSAGSPNRDQGYRFLYFSELLKRRVCSVKIDRRIGKLSDLVFNLTESFPEAVGIYLEFGWGQPTQFVPWDRVIKIEDDAIFVEPPVSGDHYPPFVDQKGWILVAQHLMGKTILDMDGRKIEVVNDVHLLESESRMIIAHVDVSLNGFLRRLGLGRFQLLQDRLISWRYVQPLSLEDAVSGDVMSLSIARQQIRELPGEDLADVLEMLSGKEQQAVFSALDSEKAAETLLEAEPRSQRQLIANLRKERARAILSKLSVPQLADLFSVLPNDDQQELIPLLSEEQGDRIAHILSAREVRAISFTAAGYIAMSKETTAGEALARIRSLKPDTDILAYIYIVSDPEKTLLGVVDLRDLILAPETKPLGEMMAAVVVTADANDSKEDLEELFAKYHYRLIPVVDAHDRLIGVIKHKDIMKGLNC